jgi:methyl-accepting chemotaxis protein
MRSSFLHSFSGLAPYIVTGVPVCFMLAYAGFTVLLRRFSLRDDQAGDNLYYMGFLFTLCSLGVSLYQFDTSSGAENIVRNFGIAIASTIAGIALRVLFNQMRRDPLDVERSARLELAEASRKVRRELDNTALELSGFRRSLQQSLTEAYDEVGKEVASLTKRVSSEFDSTLAATREPLDKATHAAGDTIGTMTSMIRARLEEAGDKLSQESERLSASSHAVNDAILAVAQQILAIKTPGDIIEQQLKPVSEILERLSRTIDDNARLSREALESSRHASAELVAVSAGLTESTSALRESLDSMEKVATQISTSLEIQRARPTAPLYAVRDEAETASNDASADGPPPARPKRWW